MSLVGVAIVTEEAIRSADLSQLSTLLANQASWSDMPFVILTRQGGGIERNPVAARLSITLGNVTFLERPFHPTTLVSIVRSALRGRKRQFEARDRLEALHNSEERLRVLNATLEERVAQEITERAAAEEALRQSQKMEAVGQLTGGVAHDFNNLLTIIRSCMDLLRRPDLSDARRTRYMDAVSDTVDRAAKLTRQLLAFARRQTLKPQIFEVGQRIRALAEMLDPIIGARIKIDMNLADSSCYVKADISQFETALVNIAMNARDAMDGDGLLTLRVERGQSMPSIRGHAGSAGPFVVVSLCDTGTGIAPDQINKIFEPFFTTKDVGKGTGLGLSQVFGFAKQSGGNVTVASIVGVGTTFEIYLPEVQAEASADDVPEADASESEGEGRHVLVVEDNIEVGQFASQILEDLGYKTTWAKNAEDALKSLDLGLDVDIVFSDVVMPGIGGIELAERIHIRWPRLPVVLTSGYSHVLAEQGSRGLDLLNKPYSADELSRILHRILHRPADTE